MKIKLIGIFIIGTIIITLGFIKERDTKLNNFYQTKTEEYDRAYRTIFDSYGDLARFLYGGITKDKNIIEIYEQLQNANEKDKNLLRIKLSNILGNKLGNLILYDIVQLQFHLKNNESFYRYFNPSKYGDNLTEIRPTVAYVNKHHKSILGIEQGRIYNANRYVFPIHTKYSNIHLGSVEISFSIESFLSKIMDEYGGKSCFMINKELVDHNVFNEDKSRYIPSNIDGYYCDKAILNALAKYDLDEIRLQTPSTKLENSIKDIVSSGKIDTVYNENLESIVTIIPIRNPVNLKQIAFIKISHKAPFVQNKILNTYKMIGTSIALLLVTLLFIYKELKSKEVIKKEKDLVQNIINSISNITFVTDFINIEYSNNSFLEFFNLKSLDAFKKLHPELLDIFLPWDNYLNCENIGNKEEFIELIINTNEINRKVMMFDKSFNLAAFSVSISKINYYDKSLYLLTLVNITEQEIHKKQIEHQAYYDGLTNVYNRTKFNELFEIELRKAKRYQIPFCIAIIDIDLFKNFNDTYGHLIGDEVLISLANEVNSHIRDTDTFARWGGEEFTIIFSDTSIQMAVTVSNKLREKINKLEHPIAGHISASFGVTAYKLADTSESMFKRCDDALYLAKENGRNRVETI